MISTRVLRTGRWGVVGALFIRRRFEPLPAKPLPGTCTLSLAVGFEVANGPITNLASEDFYVDAQLKRRNRKRDDRRAS